ncbi:MAG: Crp/Fnr family transcriptional regulator [Alphaproteobacteria bacterium]|jgi:CRP-like cAMP-binding protein|nr:MAG: Crp/Fnr family transcriptional regulator [Alphaproteobacteria bacterium]
MSVTAQGPVRGNHLLSQLSDEAYALLAPSLEHVKVKHKQVLHERDRPYTHIYFPVTCVISAILPMLDGKGVEVGSVGNEGFSAVEILTGTQSTLNNYIAQIAGDAFRMTATGFMQAVERSPELRKVTASFLHGLLSQAFQSVACNRLHTVDQRFARWILLTQDRVGGDDFYLTQEFIASMLGVHRPTVSLVATEFQRSGLIRFSRGNVFVLNRKGLEEASCECYSNVQNQFQRLLGIQYG